MAIYVLKDPVYDEYTSKINNFTLEWLKWYPFAKIAPKKHPLTRNDILIINLYEGNPYGQYTIPAGCKKIFIVHKLNLDNIKYLQDARYIIYMNDYQRQLAEIAGIKKPYISCPRHPLHNYTVKFNTDAYAYIGGWYFEDKSDGLLDRIIQLHKTIPHDLEFVYFFVSGDLPSRKAAIDSMKKSILSCPELKDRVNAFIDNKLDYNSMIFRARTCEYAYLWRNTISIDELKDAIESKDSSILSNSIYESSMLSHFQSGNAKIIAEKKQCFIAAHEDVKEFTYKDFGGILKNIISHL